MYLVTHAWYFKCKPDGIWQTVTAEGSYRILEQAPQVSLLPESAKRQPLTSVLAKAWMLLPCLDVTPRKLIWQHQYCHDAHNTDGH